jgi:hypothetical protein
MNPSQKKLALELLNEAQKELPQKFELTDLEKLLSVDAYSSEQRLRELKKAISEILD